MLYSVSGLWVVALLWLLGVCSVWGAVGLFQLFFATCFFDMLA